MMLQVLINGVSMAAAATNQASLPCDSDRLAELLNIQFNKGGPVEDVSRAGVVVQMMSTNVPLRTARLGDASIHSFRRLLAKHRGWASASIINRGNSFNGKITLFENLTWGVIFNSSVLKDKLQCFWPADGLSCYRDGPCGPLIPGSICPGRSKPLSFYSNLCIAGPLKKQCSHTDWNETERLIVDPLPWIKYRIDQCPFMMDDGPARGLASGMAISARLGSRLAIEQPDRAYNELVFNTSYDTESVLALVIRTPLSQQDLRAARLEANFLRCFYFRNAGRRLPILRLSTANVMRDENVFTIDSETDLPRASTSGHYEILTTAVCLPCVAALGFFEQHIISLSGATTILSWSRRYAHCGKRLVGSVFLLAVYTILHNAPWLLVERAKHCVGTQMFQFNALHVIIFAKMSCSLLCFTYSLGRWGVRGMANIFTQTRKLGMILLGALHATSSAVALLVLCQSPVLPLVFMRTLTATPAFALWRALGTKVQMIGAVTMIIVLSVTGVAVNTNLAVQSVVAFVTSIFTQLLAFELARSLFDLSSGDNICVQATWTSTWDAAFSTAVLLLSTDGTWVLYGTPLLVGTLHIAVIAEELLLVMTLSLTDLQRYIGEVVSAIAACIYLVWNSLASLNAKQALFCTLLLIAEAVLLPIVDFAPG